MKKNFKYSPNNNQYYYVYKGIPINIDKDDFDLMSDDDVISYIKTKTEQKPKIKPEKDILPFEQGLEEFQKGKDRLSFLKFYNSRK